MLVLPVFEGCTQAGSHRLRLHRGSGETVSSTDQQRRWRGGGGGATATAAANQHMFKFLWDIVHDIIVICTNAICPFGQL